MIEPGDEIVRYSSRGWALDGDGWWSRPIYRRDLEMALHGERVNDRFVISARAVWGQLLGEGGLIGSGQHAFAMAGRLYCRNAKQKRRLDNGLPV